jgi:hypothetical protein
MRWRALCTNWKKPRWNGSLSCEMLRCGKSQERSKDQKLFIAVAPVPDHRRAAAPGARHAVWPVLAHKGEALRVVHKLGKFTKSGAAMNA